MNNTLLAEEPLPPFPRIQPEDIEPGINALLTRARTPVDDIAARQPPTFATVVEPLEELQHRVARCCSPVRHLNAVLDSEALRNAYNACLPLLSAYRTDLEQNQALYLAYRAIEERESPTLDPARRRVIERTLEDFRRAGVGLPSEDKDRFKAVMLELARLQANFERNLLDATHSWNCHVIDPGQVRGLSELLRDRGRRRAHEQRHRGMAPFAGPADVRCGSNRGGIRGIAADILRGMDHSRLRPRTSGRTLGQRAGSGADPPQAARSRPASRLWQLRRLRARQTHGA